MIKTPAFIINQAELLRKCKKLYEMAQMAEVKLLYSVKALSFIPVLNIIESYVEGLSSSSLFEAKLARLCLPQSKELHHFSVAYSPLEMDALLDICQYLTFNSLNQLSLFKGQLKSNSRQNANWGLRVNPEISSLIDERYDPCRKGSKLGVPIGQLKELSTKNFEALNFINGIHLHTTCECEDYSYLQRLVQKLHEEIPHLLAHIQWINLGGGYLYENSLNQKLFFETVGFLQSRYNLKVIIEPGTDFVRQSVSLVAKVLDIQKSDGNHPDTAVLDSSINHLPEAYEYQDSPDIIEGTAPHILPYTFQLAGLSCLAGDLFGEYSFGRPLKVGDSITFTGIGAYSLVKANRFNGINLPSIYLKSKSGEYSLQRNYTFGEYCSHFESNMKPEPHKRVFYSLDS